MRRRALLAAPALLFASRRARAAWPERPVVPFAPGGPTDTVARWLARDLPAALGGAFVVENWPGAGGNLGISAAARERPDGHALLVVSNAFVINPALVPSGFDVLGTSRRSAGLSPRKASQAFAQERRSCQCRHAPC